jgi:hypothetical protein
VLAEKPFGFGQVRKASELIDRDPVSGLEDLTYAAAWQLGRLLGLSDRNFTREIMAWRRCCAREHKSWAKNALLAHLHCCRAPVHRPLPTRFFEALSRLEGVPFSYLVPAPEMLPPESLRAFTVDPVWVFRLMQGALSIGAEVFRCDNCDEETTNRIAALERNAADKLSALARLARKPAAPMSGILLRSEALSLWPKLLTTFKFDDAEAGRVEGFPKSPLPEVMLDLATGPFSEVTLAQPNNVPHFEVVALQDRNWIVGAPQSSGTAIAIAHRAKQRVATFRMSTG